MRHLFVPACVCLMTWSGATGSDPKLSLDEFTGAAKRDREIVARAATDIPVDMTSAEMALEAPAPNPQTKFAEPPPIPLPPVPKPVVHRSHQEICDTLTEAAQTNELPVPFFINLLFQESGFQPGIVSSAGAQGIAQFMPETATSMGLENPFDPAQAIPASARLLRELIHQFGNLGLAAAAYNAGPKRIQDWLEKKGKLPEETKGYVKIITGQPAETWTAATAAYPGQRVPRHAPCQEAAGLYAFAGPETIPLPVASPRTQPAAPVAPTKLAAVEPARPAITKLASAESAPTAFKLASSTLKISHQGQRVTAVIEVAKAARTDAVQAAKAEIKNIKAQPHVIKIAAQETKQETKKDIKKDATHNAKLAAQEAKQDAKQDTTKETKPVSQQLAASKHKSEKRKYEKLAQR